MEQGNSNHQQSMRSTAYSREHPIGQDGSPAAHTSDYAQGITRTLRMPCVGNSICRHSCPPSHHPSSTTPTPPCYPGQTVGRPACHRRASCRRRRPGTAPPHRRRSPASSSAPRPAWRPSSRQTRGRRGTCGALPRRACTPRRPRWRGGRGRMTRTSGPSLGSASGRRPARPCPRWQGRGGGPRCRPT